MSQAAYSVSPDHRELWVNTWSCLSDLRAGQTPAAPNAESNTYGHQFDDRKYATMVVFLPGLALGNPGA